MTRSDYFADRHLCWQRTAVVLCILWVTTASAMAQHLVDTVHDQGYQGGQLTLDASCEPSFQGGDCHNYCLDLWGGYCWARSHGHAYSPRQICAERRRGPSPSGWMQRLLRECVSSTTGGVASTAGGSTGRCLGRQVAAPHEPSAKTTRLHEWLPFKLRPRKSRQRR